MADESDERSYRLISGEFKPDEARELLMTLIEDKIGFHERNNWSRREHRLDTADGVKRIAVLRQTKADLVTMLEEASEAGMKLAINCNIEISLEPE